MNTEEIIAFCEQHMAIQNEQRLHGIYQRYALEELRLPDETIEAFVEEIRKPDCDEEFRKYLEPQEKLRFYFWYYREYMTQYFVNGFRSWLLTENLIIDHIRGQFSIEKMMPTGNDTESAIGLDRILDQAIVWTGEFEFRHRLESWDEKNYYQTLELFCKEKLKS